MAAAHLKQPADKLTVTDGVVMIAGGDDDMAKTVTYAELIGGRYFNVQLDWNKQMGNALYAPGKAQPKKLQGVQDRRQADPARGRRADRLLRRPSSVTDVRRPGMVHAPHDPSAGRRRDAGEGRRRLDQGHPRRPRLRRRTASWRSSPTRNGMRSRRSRAAQGRSGRTPSRRSPTRPRSTTTSARRRCASTGSKASRSATSTRRSRPPRA